MQNCVFCGISVNKAPLFRTGPMGGNPDWACFPCKQKQGTEKDIDPQVLEITNLIAGENTAIDNTNYHKNDPIFGENTAHGWGKPSKKA